MFVWYLALNSFFLVLSLTLQRGLHLSPVAAGLIYAPQALAFLAGSLITAKRRLLVTGAAITALGFASTSVVALTVGLSPAGIVPTLIVQGLGMGLFQTPLLNAVLARVPSMHAGAASGVLSTAQQIGGATGVALNRRP